MQYNFVHSILVLNLSLFASKLPIDNLTYYYNFQAWQQFAKDAARANFKDIVEGVGHCLPVMDPVNTNEPIDLNQIHFPCGTYLDYYWYDMPHCGVFLYVDPMDKCLDSNPDNNVQVIPVHINGSMCDGHMDYFEDNEEHHLAKRQTAFQSGMTANNFKGFKEYEKGMCHIVPDYKSKGKLIGNAILHSIA